MEKRYVIERRFPDGSLDLSGRQPESVFGPAAYAGLTDWDISRKVFAVDPDAVLDGREIVLWAKRIDPAFLTRQKTW